MKSNTTKIESAFSAEECERAFSEVLASISNYYKEAVSSETFPVLPPVNHKSELQHWNREIPAEGLGVKAAGDLMKDLIARSNHLHSPRYVGHQVCAPLPLAAAVDGLSSLLNNGMAVYEMGPAITAMENKMIAWMAEKIGWKQGFSGYMTSGGSLGNITALLAARQAKAGYNAWKEGVRGEKFAVLVSDQAHYCVGRAVQVMGWGEQGAIRVTSDGNYRMDVGALKSEYEKATKDGFKIIAVVASGCSTATGSFDPIDEIADFCAEKNLWLHVDGAHGASTLLSEKYRHLLKGIEKADSVVWDAHKMLMMPALITAVVFKNGQDSYKTFDQQASYLFRASAEEEWYNIGQRTIECTKNMMALKLYMSLMAYGEKMFADYVTSMTDLTKEFAEYLKSTGKFELPVEPATNIICFAARGHENIHAEIRDRIMESGRFYFVQTNLRGKTYLRATIINPLTKLEHLKELAELVLKTAEEIEGIRKVA